MYLHRLKQILYKIFPKHIKLEKYNIVKIILKTIIISLILFLTFINISKNYSENIYSNFNSNKSDNQKDKYLIKTFPQCLNQDVYHSNKLFPKNNYIRYEKDQKTKNIQNINKDEKNNQIMSMKKIGEIFLQLQQINIFKMFSEKTKIKITPNEEIKYKWLVETIYIKLSPNLKIKSIFLLYKPLKSVNIFQNVETRRRNKK